MIRFTRALPGFTVGKEYSARYTLHPVWLMVCVRVTDDDGDSRLLPASLVEDGTIEEIDNND